MNIFNTIKKLNYKQTLTNEEKNINERAIKKANENGIAPIANYNVEMRELLTIPSATKVHQLQSNTNVIHPLLDRVQYIENAQTNIIYPFANITNVQWGNGALTTQLTSKALKPHRICAQIEISKTFLNCNDDGITQQFQDGLINAIFDKVFSTMLNDGDSTQDAPKGLLYGIEPTTITSIDDLTTIQQSVDDFSNNGVWVCGSKAKKHLNVMHSTSKLFDNNKLLQSDIVYTNDIANDYLIYVDLQKILLANFGVIGITLDNVTKSVEGKTILTIDGYFDYDIANNAFIAVGKFE